MAVRITVYGTASMRQIERARKDLEALERQARTSSAGWSASMGRIQSSAERIGKKITGMGRQWTRAVTLPIVGIGAASLFAFDQVDNGLDTVAARSGATGARLADLEKVFYNVAKTSVQGMEEVGEVVGRVSGKFQVTGTDAETLARQFLTLAQVTGMDTVTAVDTVGTALTAMGIPTSRAGGFMDMLLAASQKTNISVDRLAGTVAKAAPTFKAYGLNARESIGLVAGLEGAGLPATRVVAGLNSAFKKFAAAGAKDMPAALTNVLTKIRDMKDPTKATALAVQLFGARVGVSLAEAVRTGKVSVDDLSASLDGSKGAVDRAAAAVEGPQEAWARLKNELLLAGSTLMTVMLPAIQMIIPPIKSLIDWFAGLGDGQRKVIVIVGLLAAAIGPLLLVLGAAITAVGAIAGALAAVSAPVAAVIAGIALVVAAVVLLWTKSEAFREAVMKVWEAIKSAVSEAIDGVKKKLDENRDKIEAFKAALGKAWEFIQQYVIPGIAKFYEVYLSTLIRVIGVVIQKIIDWAAFLWSIASIAAQVGIAVWNFATKVKAAITEAIDDIKALPGKVKEFFGNAITWLVEAGRNIIEGLWNGIKEKWDGFYAWMEEKVNSLPEGVKKILGIASPSRVFAVIGRAIPDGMAKGVDQLRSRVTGSVERLGRDAAAKGKQAADTIIDRISGSLDKAKDRLSRLQEFFRGARDLIVQAFSQLKDRAQARINEIAADLESLATDARSYSQAIQSALAVAFQVPGIEAAERKVIDAQEAMRAAVAEFGQEAEESTRAAKALAQAQDELAATRKGGNVLANFRADIATATEFLTQIQQLRSFGLNETSLQNIIQAGVEQGRQIAASLLAEGPGAINEVNQLQSAFTEQVTALGDLLAADKFGAQIEQAKAALVVAQEQYAAIAAREAAQLAQLDALGRQFGIQSDALTEILEGGQDRIATLLANEDTATTLLSDSVSEVTTGILDTAATMARQAAALGRRIDSLEERLGAAQAAQAATQQAATGSGGGSGSGGGRGNGTGYTDAQLAAIVSGGSSTGTTAGAAPSPTYADRVPHGAVRTIIVEKGAVQVQGGSDTLPQDLDAAGTALIRRITRELAAQ